jgi:hypothetical protein
MYNGISSELWCVINGRAATAPGIGCKIGFPPQDYPASLKERIAGEQFCSLDKRLFHDSPLIYITHSVTQFQHR